MRQHPSVMSLGLCSLSLPASAPAPMTYARSLYARDLLSASVWYSLSLWARVLFASALG